MPFYDFTFSGSFAGASYSIKNDLSGATVDTGTLGSASGGKVVHQVELDEGAYTAKATLAGSGLVAEANSIANLDDSIANQPGAAETAYFVATGPVYATDGNGAAGNLNFVADDRQGDLPDWVSLSSGDIVLGEDAGTCAFGITEVTDFDFNGATGVSGPSGAISTGLRVRLDGIDLLGGRINTPTTGDGTDTQSSDPIIRGAVITGTTLTADLAPFADEDGSVPIEDGTATPRVALTITRLAPAPVLPE